MDDISLVETLRARLLLRQRGVKLERSRADASAGSVREKNYVLFSGDRAMQTLQEFSEMLLMGDDEYPALTGLTFENMFLLILRSMCDAHRCMLYPTQKVSCQLLAVYNMTLEAAGSCIADLWTKYRSRPCCVDPQFSQARREWRKYGGWGRVVLVIQNYIIYVT